MQRNASVPLRANPRMNTGCLSIFVWVTRWARVPDQLDPARQTALLTTHKEGATVLLQDPGDKERNFDRRRFRIGDSELEQVSGTKLRETH